MKHTNKLFEVIIWLMLMCYDYAGLGSRMDDICGKDWVPGAGDHGDPGLVFTAILFPLSYLYLRQTTSYDKSQTKTLQTLSEPSPNCKGRPESPSRWSCSGTCTRA
jgi:hypothetical protein